MFISQYRIAIVDFGISVYCSPYNDLELVRGSSVSPKKGYRLTKQGKSIIKMGWKQVTSEAEGRKMLSDMTNTDTAAPTDFNMSSTPGSLLFAREVG